jgi:hypothetical protein
MLGRRYAKMANETTMVDLDFVFLDSNGDPFRVRKVSGEYWILYKHPDKRWVTLRKVESFPVLWHLQNACIDWKFHNVYEFGIPFNGDGWPSHDAPRSPKEQTCDRCDGDGKAHGSDRPFEHSGPDSYPGKCPVCKGTGTV